jgi:hypothetical protein
MRSDETPTRDQPDDADGDVVARLTAAAAAWREDAGSRASAGMVGAFVSPADVPETPDREDWMPTLLEPGRPAREIRRHAMIAAAAIAAVLLIVASTVLADPADGSRQDTAPGSGRTDQAGSAEAGEAGPVGESQSTAAGSGSADAGAGEPDELPDDASPRRAEPPNPETPPAPTTTAVNVDQLIALSEAVTAFLRKSRDDPAVDIGPLRNGYGTNIRTIDGTLTAFLHGGWGSQRAFIFVYADGEWRYDRTQG